MAGVLGRGTTTFVVVAGTVGAVLASTPLVSAEPQPGPGGKSDRQRPIVVDGPGRVDRDLPDVAVGIGEIA